MNTGRVNFRLRPNDETKWRSAAAAEGVKLSAFVRRAVNMHIEAEHAAKAARAAFYEGAIRD